MGRGGKEGGEEGEEAVRVVELESEVDGGGVV